MLAERISHQRVAAKSSKRFAIHCLSVRPAARLPRPSGKATDVAIRRLSEGIWRSGSRVGRISPVIYSMRVRDAPASFAVILTVPRGIYAGTRDEGETRLERGLKRGKGPRTALLWGRRPHDKHNIFSVREMYAYRPEKYAYYAKVYELYKSSLMKGERIFRSRSIPLRPMAGDSCLLKIQRISFAKCRVPLHVIARCKGAR